MLWYNSLKKTFKNLVFISNAELQSEGGREQVREGERRREKERSWMRNIKVPE